MANMKHKTTLDVEGLTKRFGGLLAADGLAFGGWTTRAIIG